MTPCPHRRDDPTATRRRLLQAAGTGTAVGALAALFSTGAAATATDPRPADDDRFDAGRTSRETFPQSVASGGPTPTGTIVWTRVAETAYRDDVDVGLQVTPAPDSSTPNEAADFSTADTRHFRVSGSELSPDDDYTLRVDLDGELEADRFYFYRFVYDGDASPVGRLRTLPEPDADPARLKLAVASCNRYQDGYFGALAHIAREDADYLVHLGDLIYENGGPGDHPGRDIGLPSGEEKAHTLADYRHLHRTYRGDEHMQAALERHTLVHTWDDHETVNNPWWNYEDGHPNTASHPYGDDPERMRQLFVRAIKVLTEYLPSRVAYDPDAERLHDRFRLYRRFRFGRLAEIVMTDERFYRSPPPEDAFGRRDNAEPPSREVDDPDRTMLGAGQRAWFLDAVTGSPATWKVWGNSVVNVAMKTAPLGDPATTYYNYDAWDGYEHERQLVMGEFERAARSRGRALNLVTLTGDMHALLAAYMKTDYRSVENQQPFPGAETDRVAVEFMTPGVSSEPLGDALPTPTAVEGPAFEAAYVSRNPHIEWFNWSHTGYTTVEFTANDAVYTAYSVDATVDSADAPRRLLRSYRVPEGRVELQEFDGPVTDAATADDRSSED